MNALNKEELLQKLTKMSTSLLTENKFTEKGFTDGVLIAREVVKNNQDLQEQQIKELKEYVKHKKGCWFYKDTETNEYPTEPLLCTCGLNKILKLKK